MARVHQDNEKPGTSKGCFLVPLPTTMAAVKTTRSRARDLIDLKDDEEVEAHVVANMDTYLSPPSRAHSHCEFLTTEEFPDFRAYEVKERESLRKLHIETELAKGEITRTFESNMLSLPADLPEMRLRKLIRETDNPATFDELLERLVESIGDEEEDEDDNADADVEESWESIRTVESKATDNQGQSQGHESVPEELQSGTKEDGDEWEDEEEENFKEIPETPEHSHPTRSSEEIFQTPVSRMVSEDNTKSHIGSKALKFPLQPIPAHQMVGNKSVPPPPIFQFQGNPAKEPRLVKPGEVLFSATGSPIAIAPADQAPPSAVSSSSTTQPDSTDHAGVGTPLLNGCHSGKPVCLRIENPNGQAMQVELVCRGGGGAGEEFFRNFVTDVRGFVTTRSTMMQHKLMGPRIPVSGAKGTLTSKKRSYAPSSARKPMWRN